MPVEKQKSSITIFDNCVHFLAVIELFFIGTYAFPGHTLKKDMMKKAWSGLR